MELAVKVWRRATASLPILGSMKLTVRQKAVKVRPLLLAISVLVEKLMHFLLSNHRNPNMINYMQIYDRLRECSVGKQKIYANSEIYK